MYRVMLWLLNVIGFALHVGIRGKLSSGDPRTRWNTFKEFMLVHVFAIVLRFVIELLVFGQWVKHPDLLSRILTSFMPAGPVKNILLDFSALNLFWAFLFGVLFDYLMDLAIGWLQKKFPSALGWLSRELPGIQSTGETEYLSKDQVDKIKADSAKSGE